MPARRLLPDAPVIWVLVASLSLGCGSSGKPGPAMGDVSGTVRYRGKPVANASVVFLPKTPDTRAAAVTTDADGDYRLSTYGVNDGAVVGSFQVSIVARAPYDGPVPEGMSSAYAKEVFQNSGQPVIPERYFSPNTSGLTAEVKPGANVFDFPLPD
jgi:hypothetical protein